ncbi:tRNA-modifying protein YgfZ [Colwellia sp. 1_MG-2023]|uniref:tRNA-modifying protein YgfZ n=1 Tax=Colwellia sp. 1_MG-2023 TaxID=3062649 RepID=UPI0026E272B1|nr:tRNA-modifying protein YgfZ [Colwellia sp. 1_MG-2023]MDO6446582.1 tRNA-modifying protein YgfZ [Colwellia sp. 1_MG-2023]
MTIAINTTKPSLENLPSNYLISLEDYSAISLKGEEQSKYLQGQVTCDVNELEQKNLLNGAHCNAKGKVFACFRLFNRQQQHLLFQPKSTIEPSLAELKKFGVFAKVEISATDQLSFIAVVGEQAVEKLKNQFSQIPDNLTPVIQQGTTTLVYIAGNVTRYLIIDEAEQINHLITTFELPVFSTEIWKLLEIIEGIPALTLQNDNEYVPQMLNMQAIQGISFTKGCYLGQETVARMQYLGKNKKALFALSGENTEVLVKPVIEKQLGENWRKAGDVTSIYQADNGQCYIQAVLNNDIESSTQLRIKDHPASSLSIIELPYTLNQE